MGLDPRTTPARPDLAADHLRGQVTAARFAAGTPMRVAAATAPLRAAPDHAAGLLTEALFGEAASVYERRGGWAWLQLATDGYVGWMPDDVLAPPGAAQPTHKVAALRTLVFPAASIKLPPLAALSIGSLVSVVEISSDSALAELATGGFVPRRHLAALDAFEPDFVAVAERFLGAPYLWGGRSSLGLDCSGLVQLSLAAAGILAPRDSDMQEAAVGEAVAAAGPFRRGDLLFWPGHVAIARGDGSIVHANAHHMAVAIEDADGALARIAAALRTVRRLPAQ